MLPCSASWQKLTRIYSAELSQDLFGCWVVVRAWGRIGSKHGQRKIQSFDTYLQAQKHFSAVARKRLQRGYVQRS